MLIEIILNKTCVFYVFVLFTDFLKSSLKTYGTHCVYRHYECVKRKKKSYFLIFFQDLESSIADHKSEFDFVNKVADEIRQGNAEDNLQIQLRELNTRWADIPTLLKERCTKLENGS